MGEKASALFDFFLEKTVGVGLISWIQGYSEDGPAEEVLKKGIKEKSHFEVRWPAKDKKKSNPTVPAIIMETGTWTDMCHLRDNVEKYGIMRPTKEQRRACCTKIAKTSTHEKSSIKNTKRKTQFKAPQNLLEKIRKEKNYDISSSDSDDEISRMTSDRLRNKLAVQIEENKRLKAELRGYKDSERMKEDLTSILRDTQKILKDTQEILKENKMSGKDKNDPRKMSGKDKNDPRKIKLTSETSKNTLEKKSVSCSSDSGEVMVTGTAETEMPEKETLCSDTVDLGYAIKVERRALQLCCHKSFSKLVMDLMVLIFSKDEMANCSLTGKMSNAHGGHVTKLKPALDCLKVRAVVDYVKSIFPEVEENAIRTSIRNKLKYESVKINGRQYHKALKKTSAFDETAVTPSAFNKTDVTFSTFNEEIENASQSTNMPTTFFETFVKDDFVTGMVLV